MKMRVAVGASCLVIAAFSAAQVNRPVGGGLRQFRGDVPLILVRAIQAQPMLRYTGTYTVEFRQVQPPVRHQEYITRQGSKYRIEFPSGSKFAGQVIVEDDVTRLYYHPNTNEILQLPPRHGEAWDKVRNLAIDKKYQLATAPGEVVAGLKTDQVIARDLQGNILERLYIEPASGVILKRLVFDTTGPAIQYFEFNSIDLNPKIDGSAFRMEQKGAKLITPVMQLQRISTRRGFSYRYLPPATGFQLEGAGARKFAGIEGLVQTYLNGKVRLWIYQLKAPVDPDRLRQQAAKNQQFFSFQSNGETVVLIGNIPERTLERFGSMLTPGTLTPTSKL